MPRSPRAQKSADALFKELKEQMESPEQIKTVQEIRENIQGNETERLIQDITKQLIGLTDSVDEDEQDSSKKQLLYEALSTLQHIWNKYSSHEDIISKIMRRSVIEDFQKLQFVEILKEIAITQQGANLIYDSADNLIRNVKNANDLQTLDDILMLAQSKLTDPAAQNLLRKRQNLNKKFRTMQPRRAA